MKRKKIRLSIASAMVSVSLLGLTGVGFADNHSLRLRGTGGSWCC